MLTFLTSLPYTHCSQTSYGHDYQGMGFRADLLCQCKSTAELPPCCVRCLSTSAFSCFAMYMQDGADSSIWRHARSQQHQARRERRLQAVLQLSNQKRKLWLWGGIETLPASWLWGVLNMTAGSGFSVETVESAKYCHRPV